MSIEILNGFVYRIQNFITKEEQDNILNEVSKIKSWDSYKTENDWWSDKSGDISHMPETSAINNRVLQVFENFSKIDPIGHVNRLRPGQFMGSHHDASGHERIKFGVVIYLNDNFSGGDLNYPDYNFSVSPIARSLVIHPGNVEHEVSMLESGIRYSLTTFVHGNDYTKIAVERLKLDS